jgi:hypothetical protein
MLLVLGVIILGLIVVVAMPGIFNMFKNMFFNFFMQIRQDLVVAPLKGRVFRMTIPLTDIPLVQINFGDKIIKGAQALLSYTPPPDRSEIFIEGKDGNFEKCEISGDRGSCMRIRDSQVEYKINDAKLHEFKFWEKGSSDDKKTLLIGEDDEYLIRYSYSYDLMFDASNGDVDNTGNNKIQIVGGVPEIFYAINSKLEGCYKAANMAKEGDPFYKAPKDNPYFCAEINITVPDDVTLKLRDFDDFLKTTINTETRRLYGSYLRPLQLVYCFPTTECMRSTKTLFVLGAEEKYSKACFPIDLLDNPQEISIKDNLHDDPFIMGLLHSAAGSLGFIAGLTAEGKLECDTTKMLEHFEAYSTMNNKRLRIYYWDDNGEGIQALNDVFRAMTIDTCSGALVMSSQYYDYFNRQVDPLVICLEDL